MKIRKGLSTFILLALEKSIDGYVRYDDLIHHSYSYAWGSGWNKPLKKATLAKALKRLRENGMVDFLDDKELIMRLTDEGKFQALWAKLKFDKEKWDRKWRLVIWDVPERKRAIRDLLRSKLKELGFKHWQKSVWATKKNCTKLLRKFIKQVGIERWVMIIESDNVGDIP